MSLFFRKLNFRFYYIVAAIVFVLLYPAFYFFSRKESRYTTLNFFRKIFTILTCSPSGIFFRNHYLSAMDPKKTYVICVNHNSFLDIQACMQFAKGSFFFMGKHELLDNFAMKLFFQTIDVPVNRDSKIASYKAFKKAGENIKKGMSLVIFPEGTIHEILPPRVHDFKSGPFRLAIEMKVPILPVTMVNNWEAAFDDGKKTGLKPTVCKVIVHPEIDTSNMTEADVELLQNQTREIIKSTFEKYNPINA